MPRTGGSGAKVKLRASAKGELWAGANSELPRPELKSWLPVKGVEPYVAVQAVHTPDTIPPDNPPLANGRESKRKRMHRNGTEALSWGGPAVVI